MFEVGDYQGSISLLRQALELEGRLPDSPKRKAIRAESLERLGFSLYGTQQWADAEAVLSECIPLESELLGNNKLPLVKRMLNLARIYNAQEKYSQALAETRQAKNIVIKAGASESDDMAKCLSKEGEIQH